MRAVATALLAVLVLGGASTHVAHAQVPASGATACACTSFWTDEAIFLAFKLDTASTNDAPDVLYDEAPTGGPNTGGARAADPSFPLWTVPPNWRTPQDANDGLITFNAVQGLLAVDSDIPFRTGGDFGAIDSPQAVCSYPGTLAPRTADRSGGIVVEWRPIIEVNATDPSGLGACTVAGEWQRGFVIGYDVYRIALADRASPTLRDFLERGFIGLADVSKLDFNVSDPDGMSGSDLDPTDGLTLRNPDGMPDTGDEILSYVDPDARGALAHWYRLQPVVRGRQAAYGMSSSPPASRLDLDGDTTPESVDILNDGWIEFIDPSGRGLGLTDGREILSSLLAGRGEPVPVDPWCGGDVTSTREAICDDGVDNDDDGPIDCADSDCADNPVCTDMDADMDGFPDPEDCAPQDPMAWRVPVEVESVRVRRDSASFPAIVMTWIDQAPFAGSGTVHDVVRGVIADLVASDGVGAGGCLAARVAGGMVDDPADFDPSPSRRAYWYLVRAANTCGRGPYGNDSRDRARIVGAGDCP